VALHGARAAVHDAGRGLPHRSSSPNASRKYSGAASAKPATRTATTSRWSTPRPAASMTDFAPSLAIWFAARWRSSLPPVEPPRRSRPNRRARRHRPARYAATWGVNKMGQRRMQLHQKNAGVFCLGSSSAMALWERGMRCGGKPWPAALTRVGGSRRLSDLRLV